MQGCKRWQDCLVTFKGSINDRICKKHFVSNFAEVHLAYSVDYKGYGRSRQDIFWLYKNSNTYLIYLYFSFNLIYFTFRLLYKKVYFLYLTLKNKNLTPINIVIKFTVLILNQAKLKKPWITNLYLKKTFVCLKFFFFCYSKGPGNSRSVST